MEQHRFTLNYFRIRGRAEAARLILEYAGRSFIIWIWSKQGAKYEDKMPNWPAYKSELLFQQLPELIDGDFHVVQSKAIVRHLGREFSTNFVNTKLTANKIFTEATTKKLPPLICFLMEKKSSELVTLNTSTPPWDSILKETSKNSRLNLLLNILRSLKAY